MITDITDQFQGVNPYDRVYLSDSGYKVKVRVQQTASDPSRLNFDVTGSHCDDNGNAEPFGDGWFIVEPHEISVHSDSETEDLPGLIEAARRQTVRRVEWAVINRITAQTIPGVLIN